MMIILTGEPDIVLYQNYPNPFNNYTNIRYELLGDYVVMFEFYDSMGNLIKTLDGGRHSGVRQYKIRFDNLPSGVYYYKVNVDGKLFEIKKMLMVK